MRLRRSRSKCYTRDSRRIYAGCARSVTPVNYGWFTPHTLEVLRRKRSFRRLRTKLNSNDSQISFIGYAQSLTPVTNGEITSVTHGEFTPVTHEVERQ